MIKKNQILSTLDSFDGQSIGSFFVSLGHPYSYLIDCRLNVFADGDFWAIAVERLGYNPRGGFITLEVFYYGNCIMDAQAGIDADSNVSYLTPVDDDVFFSTTDGFDIRSDSEYWLVRGKKVELSHNIEDYRNIGIDIAVDEPIPIENAAAACGKACRSFQGN